MNKHTPGPWKVANKTYPFVYAIDPVCDVNRFDLLINGGCTSSGRTKPEELMANARLIAAAPDLLEACKVKLLALEGKEYDPGAFDIAAELCRKAIAKAEGTKP